MSVRYACDGGYAYTYVCKLRNVMLFVYVVHIVYVMYAMHVCHVCYVCESCVYVCI